MKAWRRVIGGIVHALSIISLAVGALGSVSAVALATSDAVGVDTRYPAPPLDEGELAGSRNAAARERIPAGPLRPSGGSDTTLFSFRASEHQPLSGTLVVTSTGVETIALDARVNDVHGDLVGRGTRAALQTSATISVHVHNPEGIEIGSIQGLDFHPFGREFRPKLYTTPDGGAEVYLGLATIDSSTHPRVYTVPAGWQTIKAVFNGMELTQHVNVQENTNLGLTFDFPRVEATDTILGCLSASGGNTISVDYTVPRWSEMYTRDQRPVHFYQSAYPFTEWGTLTFDHPFFSVGYHWEGTTPPDTRHLQITGDWSYNISPSAVELVYAESVSGVDNWSHRYVGGPQRPAFAGRVYMPCEIPTQPFELWWTQGTNPIPLPSPINFYYVNVQIHEEDNLNGVHRNAIWVRDTGYYLGYAEAYYNYHYLQGDLGYQDGYWDDFPGSYFPPSRTINSANFKMSSVPYDLTGTGVGDQNQPPVASFTYSPDNPVVDRDITFDASSSDDPDGEIESYAWDFEDGDSAEGEVVTHAYTETGEYTVTLTVIDNDGLTDSAELSLEVKRIPVLLVHGYCDSAAMWGSGGWPGDGPFDFEQALKDQGFVVTTTNLIPKPTNDSIWNYGSQLYGKITQMKVAYEVDQVDIVAHSLGGLAARAYAWQNSSLHDVRTLIMLGTPNNGSGLLSGRYWRFLRPVLAAHTLGFLCQGLGEAAHQMTPGSPFLRDLNSAGLQPSIENYYTIAGNKPILLPIPLSWFLRGQDDGVVTVDSVQAIPGTTNYVDYVDHFEYDDDPTIFDTIVNILRGTASSAATSIQVQQSGTDYQESALIEDSVAVGDENYHSIPVDYTASEVHFILASEGGELDFTLTSPQGTPINPTVAASDPLITYTKAITTLIGYDVTSPEQGNWTARVAISGTAPSEVSYAMLALLDSDLGLSILLDENVYRINDPVPLTAQLVNASAPVTGATVTAQVESPDASTQTISLYDDGSHGDAQASDGMYSNIYTNTATVGVYEVTVAASGTISSEQFVRETATTIWVEQTPTCIVTTTADSGSGSLRDCIQNASAGDTITFDSAVFPPTGPVTIALTSGQLPDLDDGNVTIDASNAGVILDGSGIGTTPETVLLDDVSLTLDGGPDLINNGDFGSGLGHWRPWDDGPGGTRGLNGTDFHSSPASYEWDVVAHTGDSRTVYDVTDTSGPVGDPFDDSDSTAWITATGGSAVELRFWYRHGGVGVSLHVLFPDDEDDLGDWWFDEQADWMEAVISETLPGDAIAVGIEFRRGHSERWTDGLRIRSDGNAVQGLQIVHFPNHGVLIDGGVQDNVIGGDSTIGDSSLGQGNLISGNGGTGVSIRDSGTMSNTVSGNTIGTNISGTAALPNGDRGIYIVDGASYNVIGGDTPGERNLISGNDRNGVHIEWDGTEHNVVVGNYIGTDASGTVALPNGESGIEIDDGAHYNVIGGDTSGERNLISGNGGHGVMLGDDVMHNVISGNTIGTDVSGTAALPNDDRGVYVIGGASYNVIGGDTTGEGNLISGNRNRGVHIEWDGTDHNIVVGNYVGTDASGTVALPNGENGVEIDDGAHYNVIGGDASGERNLISGNGGHGVMLGDDVMHNVISGNYIGTNINGTAAIENAGNGVHISSRASHNLVGGVNATPGGACTGACNLISGNGDEGWETGVWIADNGTVSNTISGNYIGTDVSGTAKLGNAADGVRLDDGPEHNIIGGATPGERNLISGNGRDGVDIGGAHDNLVIGNHIGTDSSGTAALGNVERGIGINEAGQGLATTRNTIARNLISGNGTNGMDIYGTDTVSNAVRGNLIGTDAAGMSALENGGSGIWIGGGASYNLIGGSNATPGVACSQDCNLISGNGWHGVRIEDNSAMSNTVSGNYIGTDISGTMTVSNGGAGVYVDSGAQYNLIGGVNTDPGGYCSGECNLIGGNNGDGVWIEGGWSDLEVFPDLTGLPPDYVGTFPVISFLPTDDAFASADGITPTTASGDPFYDLFAARFTGVLHISVSGEYTFTLGSDDGSLLYIDGDLVIERNYLTAYSTSQATLSLAAGSHPIVIEFFENYGAAGLALDSSGPATVTLTTDGSTPGLTGEFFQFEGILYPTSHNVVSGNYIGTDVSGSYAISNTGEGGIRIGDGAQYNTVGGDTPGERNLISGNGADGVAIIGVGTVSNTVSGNIIGTDASGSHALPNTVTGVYVGDGASYNVVGGDTPGEGNLISGNGADGIGIIGVGTVNNTVSGNTIGTDASGSHALPNTVTGVYVGDGASYNVVGGDTPGEGNLISGNGVDGVGISGVGTMGNTVRGNAIGTDLTGSQPLPNALTGVYVGDGASQNTVGVGNTIAFNGGDGVQVQGSDTLSNTITRNSIYSNTAQGIYLGDGGNAELAAPVITGYDLTTGVVTGTACAGCTVEVFSDSSDEGEVCEGWTIADGAGDFTFNKGAPFAGPHLTATATDADGNTSEFSVPTSYTESRLVDPGDAPPVDFPSVRLTLDCAVGPGGTVTVTLHNTDYPNPPSGIGVMSGYWEITSDFGGPFTCDLTFGYDEGDLNGAAESDIAGAARWVDADARWDYLGGTVDTDANTVTLTDVDAFSPWLLITSAPPQAVDDLNGSRSGSDVQLSWSAVTEDILGNAVTPDYYVVYRRSDDPYFLPDAADIIATPSVSSYTDPGILGDPDHNHYYLVTAVDGDGVESALSNRLGAFDFPLVPAAQAGERMYNLIAMNLEVPGVNDADALASYVGGGVYMVLRYDAPTQSIVWRLPGLAGENFAVEVGEPYFLYLDDTAPGVLSLVGRVLSKDAVRFSLTRPEPGESCTYNFVTVPLHRDDLVDADGLAADIGGVYMAIRYNATTQDLTWRMPGVAGENFPVRAGYPYIVCLDETAPPIWP